MARSCVVRRSTRSTNCWYLVASSAYLTRSRSTGSSSVALVSLAAIFRLQRRQLGSEVRKPGGVLENDHGSQLPAALDQGDRRKHGVPLAPVGQLVGDLLRAQRGALR